MKRKFFLILKIGVLILTVILFTSFFLFEDFLTASPAMASGACIRCVRVGRGWYECRGGFKRGGTFCISEGALCQHDGGCK